MATRCDLCAEKRVAVASATVALGKDGDYYNWEVDYCHHCERDQHGRVDHVLLIHRVASFIAEQMSGEGG